MSLDPVLEDIGGSKELELFNVCEDPVPCKL